MAAIIRAVLTRLLRHGIVTEAQQIAAPLPYRQSNWGLVVTAEGYDLRKPQALDRTRPVHLASCCVGEHKSRASGTASAAGAWLRWRTAGF